MGRVILWGWIALIAIVLGLVIGFILYSRLVVGIGLTDQLATLRLPPNLVVEAETDDLADITLQGEVAVDVPFKNDALPLPLKGDYRTIMQLDTDVPLRLMIEYEDVIPITTEAAIDTNAREIISGLLPRHPIVGNIPLEFDLPVKLRIPVDTVIRFQYTGPVLVSMDQVITPAVDTVLNTSITLNHDVSAPVLNRLRARIHPHDPDLSIILTDTVLRLPLRDLNIFYVNTDKQRENSHLDVKVAPPAD